jgi:hypothetical protein
MMRKIWKHVETVRSVNLAFAIEMSDLLCGIFLQSLGKESAFPMIGGASSTYVMFYI